MEVKVIHEMARQQGIAPEAVDEVVAMTRAHFDGLSPMRPADVEAYIRSVPVWVKLGMTEETFQSMPDTWRLNMGYQYAPPPPPVHARRPVYRDMTPQEHAQFEAQSKEEGWSLEERRTRAMMIQQSPPPEKG